MENTQNIKDLIQKFYPHAKEKLGFDHPVRVIMRQDAENAQQSLGKTAYYDPAEKLIVLYVTNRHPKDVLRSFSHELVHHAQNCRGELDDLTTDGHYAKDGKGREIEEEAYLQGNLNLRDYEDSIKFQESDQMKSIKEQNELGDIIDKLYDGPRDKKGVPLEKPPLKKDWKKDPIGRKQRVDFRKWYTTYGPGSKQKDSGGGMTSPKGPATDDPSFDYQTKLPPKDPYGLEKYKTMRPAMSRKEWVDTYHETLPGMPTSPEDAMKDLAKAKDEKRMEDAIKIEKALAQLDVNAFRKSYSEFTKDLEDFDASFSRKPFFSTDRGSDYERKMKKYAQHRTGTKTGLARDALKEQNGGVNKMKLTKNQLMGLIERTIEAIVTEKVKNPGKYMGGARQKAGIDDDGDGVPNKADKNPKDGSVKEQEMTVKANVTVPPEGQRILDLFDSFLAQSAAEDAETQALVLAMLKKAEEKGVDIANPDSAIDLEEVDVDEMHCGGKRDDELEEQEVVTPRSAKEKKEEEEKKKGFKKRNPEISKALEKVKLRDKDTAVPSDVKMKESNDTWYNSSLYESLKSKWTK